MTSYSSASSYLDDQDRSDGWNDPTQLN